MDWFLYDTDVRHKELNIVLVSRDLFKTNIKNTTSTDLNKDILYVLTFNFHLECIWLILGKFPLGICMLSFVHKNVVLYRGGWKTCTKCK